MENSEKTARNLLKTPQISDDPTGDQADLAEGAETGEWKSSGVSASNADLA